MLSIIIPTLNEEKVLEQTLKSVRDLKAVDYELIVSDGGSADSTLEIAKKYADKTLTNQGGRQTIAEGRNAGAAAAIGDYLVFIDADVTIPKINDFFNQALGLFEKETKLTGLTVFLKVLPEHVTLSDKLFFTAVNLESWLANNIFHIGAACGEFQMIRASAFKLIGGYNPKLAVSEDNELFSRLSHIGRTRVETGLFVYHTSRRAHNIGWTKLLFLWWINFIYIKVLKRSFSKEWTVIR